MQQGFAEGVAILLLAYTGSLLPAHVLIFVLEVRAKSQEPCFPGGAVVIFQPVQTKSPQESQSEASGRPIIEGDT